MITLSRGVKTSAIYVLSFRHKARVWRRDGQIDGQTDGQNHDHQERASIAASRGENGKTVKRKIFKKNLTDTNSSKPLSSSAALGALNSVISSLDVFTLDLGLSL